MFILGSLAEVALLVLIAMLVASDDFLVCWELWYLSLAVVRVDLQFHGSLR